MWHVLQPPLINCLVVTFKQHFIFSFNPNSSFHCLAWTHIWDLEVTCQENKIKPAVQKDTRNI